MGWTASDDAWLVETISATSRDLTYAKETREAVTWLRAFAPEVDEATVRAVEEGRMLLVLETLQMPSFDGPPQGVSLLELAGETLAPQPQEPTEWVDVRVVDRKGRPRAGVLYELTLPDASVKSGRTNAEGHIRVENLYPIGDCKIRFPELDAPAPSQQAPSQQAPTQQAA